MGLELKFTEADVMDAYAGQSRELYKASIEDTGAPETGQYSANLFINRFTSIGAYAGEGGTLLLYMKRAMGDKLYTLTQAALASAEATNRGLFNILVGNGLTKEAELGKLVGRHLEELSVMVEAYNALEGEPCQVGDVDMESLLGELPEKNRLPFLERNREYVLRNIRQLVVTAERLYQKATRQEFLANVKAGMVNPAYLETMGCVPKTL